MEITQMRYFLDVAETEHITESAGRLHLAQPALSRSIHRLEEEVGVPLFRQKGRNIVLTEYGRYLAEELRPVMERLEALPGELAERRERDRTTVRLNVLAASTMVTDAVVAYQNRNRDVQFRLMQNAEREQYDIGVTTQMEAERENETDHCYLCEEKIFLAVPNTEQYAGRKSISLAEAAEEGFISLMGSKQFRAICDRFLRRAGIVPKISFESDSPYAVKNMIAANLGIGFWPEFTWGRLDSDRVRLLAIEDFPCRRDVVITCRRRRDEHPASGEFFDFLKDYCAMRQRSVRNSL